MTAQLSREWLQKTISDIETMREEMPFGLDEDGNNTLAALKLALAGMDREPVAWWTGPEPTPTGEIESIHDHETGSHSIPLYAAPPAPVAVPDDVDSLRRDANRYRFLRDKDAFGEENEPGLVTWGELTELELNEFDAAIDARMSHPNVAWVQPVKCADGDSMAEVYAELYRLREEVKGPEGFATWKDAAIAERISKKSARNIPDEIDYLHAMAAFHSDKWHKMDPITGYMLGWNACRAAMQAEPVTATNITGDNHEQI